MEKKIKIIQIILTPINEIIGLSGDSVIYKWTVSKENGESKWVPYSEFFFN